MAFLDALRDRVQRQQVATRRDLRRFLASATGSDGTIAPWFHAYRDDLEAVAMRGQQWDTFERPVAILFAVGSTEPDGVDPIPAGMVE